VNIHAHQKCPRCQAPIGRADTMCWACRHVVVPPRIHTRNVWLVPLLEVLAAAVIVVFLLKYRTQVVGTLRAALRSLLKP
jgi:predicted nucleic acid-binding Zn ribbon protein